MKKLIALVALFVPVVAFAQAPPNDATATVNVSATINAILEMEKVQDLTFGNITNIADSAHVVATSGTIHNSGESAQRGMVDFVAGIDSAFVEIVVPDSVLISDVNAVEDDITVYLEYAYSNTSETTGAAYVAGDTVELISDNGIGATVYGRIFIGGHIKAADMTGKEGAQFRGSITINANFF